ncbi:MAG: hypothetical protein ACJA08_002631 [Cyclobacteriaceae bacterium]|jgi:hypothetical protein
MLLALSKLRKVVGFEEIISNHASILSRKFDAAMVPNLDSKNKIVWLMSSLANSDHSIFIYSTAF